MKGVFGVVLPNGNGVFRPKARIKNGAVSFGKLGTFTYNRAKTVYLFYRGRLPWRRLQILRLMLWHETDAEPMDLANWTAKERPVTAPKIVSSLLIGKREKTLVEGGSNALFWYVVMLILGAVMGGALMYAGRLK